MITMSKLKQYLSGLLAALMVLTLLPTSAWAATTISSGRCGDNLTYTLDNEGTLTISGTGEMTDAQWERGVPWYDLRDSVKKAVIKSGVTSIGDYAFCQCLNLSSVTIPSTVTRIGDNAFAYAYGLSGTLTIPNSVTTIGHWAFNCCRSLSSVTIGSGVTAIGKYSFAYCSGLSSITIPAGIRNIGEKAFHGCEGLQSIQVASGNRNYASDSSGVLFNKAKTELILCPAGFSGSYSIPTSVTKIADNAFYKCKNLSSVTIPSGVTSIGEYTFCQCQNLSSITIPNAVTSIGTSTFNGCTSLSSITLGSNITSIGNWAFDSTAYYNNADNWTDGLLYLGAYLLEADSDITSAAIRSGTKVIADYAFDGCRYLNSVTIPSGIVTIGNCAFEYCSALSSVTIPGTVTTIGYSAFYRCTGLSSITLPASVTSIGDRAFYNCTGLGSISIGSKVTGIGSMAFADTAYANNESNWTGSLLYLGVYLLQAREDITSASVRSGTKVIADNAFSNSTLTSVSLPGSLVTVGNYAFAWCPSLSSVTIPSGVTTIGNYAFGECTSLSSVSIPASVTYIGDYAFTWCTKLSSVTLPKGLDTIHAGTFFVCSALKELTVPEGVTAIESYAFGVYYTGEGCDSLKKVTLPESLTSVGENAFSGCGNMKDVYYVGSQTQWKDISVAVYNDPLTDATIHYNCMATPVAPKVSSSIVTSTGKIKLTWSAVDGAAKYYIYRSTDGGKTYKYYDSTSKTSYTNTSVTPGTKYYYKLKSVSVTGEKSAYSNAVYRTADCAKPSLSSSIVSSSGAIKLTWDKVTGAAKYYIYRSTDGGTTYKYYTSTTSTSWTNKSVTPGTKYYYKIKAICSNSEGNSAYSNVVYRTADCAKPSLSSSIVSSSGAIKLSWSKVTGATKYYIYRSTDGGTTYKYYTSTTSTSWTNKNVTPGKTYYYKIKAICSNTEGNSAYSNVVSRTADCAKPVVTIQLNGGKPQLKWSAVTGASKYYIYRSTDGTSFSFFDSTTKLSYTNTGAKSGTTYYYKVKAICSNTEGNSAYSNVVSIKSK